MRWRGSQGRYGYQVIFRTLGLRFPSRRQDKRPSPKRSFHNVYSPRQKGRRDLVDVTLPSFPHNASLATRQRLLSSLHSHQAALQHHLAAARVQSFLLTTELTRTLLSAQEVFNVTPIN